MGQPRGAAAAAVVADWCDVMLNVSSSCAKAAHQQEGMQRLKS